MFERKNTEKEKKLNFSLLEELDKINSLNK